MDTLNFQRSLALNNIPTKKLQEAIAAVENSSDTLEIKAVKLTAINRYYESNIPLGYWSLKMERDFVGDPNLLAKYNEYIKDIKQSYLDGISICFAGGHGKGKTFTLTSILKKASQKNFSCLYTSISNIVDILTSSQGDDKYLAKRELVMVDFLVIDEVDVRFFNQSDTAKDLYGRTFENVIRTRLQNKMPTLLATNSPNIKESFASFFKDSLGSLLSKIEIFPVMGTDHRKVGDK